jgi:calcineurin-like phosphoesterase family protein
MNIWVTSDTHFSHANIIRFCSRPFTDVFDMDQKLIQAWNTWVKPEDHVYHLGDVTLIRGGKAQQDQLKGWVSQLNGHKRLILGNHDHFEAKAYLEAGFEKIRGTGRWLDNCWLSHFPIHESSLGGADACVHGHIHEQAPPKPVTLRIGDKFKTIPYVNVCVERTAYRPLHWDEVKAQIKSLVEPKEST